MHRIIFDETHERFREAVRGFLLREGAPHTEEWEQRGMVDPTFWRRAAEQGLVGFSAPEEHGGTGLTDFAYNVVVDEEVALGGIVGDNFNLLNDIIMPYLLDLATPEQQARWLPGVTTGESVFAIAMSEPGAGSDLRGIATTATRDGDTYVVNGAKTFVTSGIQADHVIVAANLRDGDATGMVLLVVDATAGGFSRGRKLEKVGRKAQDTAELFFDDVVVGADAVLGTPGRGLHHLMANLPQERLSMAVIAIAAARRALDLTLDYVSNRNAFGQPIGSFQANRFALADLEIELQVGRAYVDRCVSAHASDDLSAVEAAAAKVWCTELQFRVMDRCLQLHGGYGYMDEYEISRLWRDARITRIYGGTSEIMREIVGRSMGL